MFSTKVRGAKLYFDWDLPGAELSFKQSIRLNSNYGLAHHFYANELIVLGRFDEAIAEFKRALEIDSLSLVANASLGYCYYFARRYDLAIAQCKEAIELNEHFELAHVWLGWAYEQKGMYKEAISEFEKAISLSGGRTGIVAALGTALALSGDTEGAKRILDDLSIMAKDKYVSPYRVGCIYAALSDFDTAFECLEQAYEDRSHMLVGLKIDPRLDALQGDPRLEDLIRRTGL